MGLKLLSLAGYDSEGNYVDIPFTLNKEGKINWNIPAPDYKVYALFQRMTRQKVKRAAPGGEGYVVDYFSKEASQFYFKKFIYMFACLGISFLMLQRRVCTDFAIIQDL